MSSAQPFLTLYTPTYRRPHQLAKCLESVRTQTIVHNIEQIVIPDHIGVGVGGMFLKVADYAPMVHGQYVHLLCDDDVLANSSVVEQVRDFAREYQDPPMILVRARKGDFEWPRPPYWPPKYCEIDLSCLITRADVWRAHVTQYTGVYEGDFHFADAVCRSGHSAAFCDVQFVIGGVSRGAPEAVCT